MDQRGIYVLFICVAFLLLAGGVYYWQAVREDESMALPGGEDQTVQPTVSMPPVQDPLAQPTASPVSSGTRPIPKPAPKKAPVKPSYDEALQLYGKYRFQILECHGTPGTMTVKVGSSVMLDNKDVVMRKISFGSNVSYVGGRDFAIVVARDVGSFPLLCDGAGAARLIVQP